MTARLVVVGDLFLDVDLDGRATRLSPEGPLAVVEGLRRRCRPGGAALAAVLAARAGGATTLVADLADDEAGDELRGLVGAAGVDVVAYRRAAGTERKVRVRADGRTVVRLDEGRPTSEPQGPSARSLLAAALGAADAVLVADYGRGLTDDEDVRRLVAHAATHIPVVWDPHPRGASPTPGCWAVTPNRSEVFALSGRDASGELRDLRVAAGHLRERWAARAVVVTLDREGALMETGLGPPLVVPAPEVAGGDPCGAGDAFAAALAQAAGFRLVASEAVDAAVDAASRFVGSGGAAAVSVERPDGPAATPLGGSSPRPPRPRTVVAGGCFDVLHVGHVRLLEQARRLGDRLVVLLNSDASVRALKGEPRPMVPEAERAAVLRALTVVDDVVVFDELTPEHALRSLRPDVFVKGGDYGHGEIPEQAVLDEWGGQAVVLPYLEGRSTTRLLEEAARHGADIRS